MFAKSGVRRNASHCRSSGWSRPLLLVIATVTGIVLAAGVVLVLAAVGMALIYVATFQDDSACIQKFGQEYARYMQRVPRVNFLAGIVRLLARSRPNSREI